LLQYGVINPDAIAPRTSANSEVHETGVAQRNAALRAMHGATFQLVLLAIFQATFLSIEKFAVLLREVNVFPGSLQQRNEITKAVFLFIHAVALLDLRTIS
jgi:hypothetical protein